MKRLKKLKDEPDCNTWAELMGKLSRSSVEPPVLGKEILGETERGVRGYLALRGTVTKKWSGPPTVLSEMRKTRRDESSRANTDF